MGAKVVLGDRAVRVTLARSWAALAPWSRARFVWTLLRTGCCVPVDGLKAEVEAMKVPGSCGTPPAVPASAF